MSELTLDVDEFVIPAEWNARLIVRRLANPFHKKKQGGVQAGELKEPMKPPRKNDGAIRAPTEPCSIYS